MTWSINHNVSEASKALGELENREWPAYPRTKYTERYLIFDHWVEQLEIIFQGRIVGWNPGLDFLERPDHWITTLMPRIISSDDMSTEFFVFYQEDCFDPPLYLVQADSWEDAVDLFNDEVIEPIAEEDLNDYMNDEGVLECSFNSNAEPIDDLSVRGYKVKLISLSFWKPVFVPDFIDDYWYEPNILSFMEKRAEMLLDYTL